MRRLIYFALYAVILAALFNFIPPGIFLTGALLFLLSGSVLTAREYKERVEGIKKETGLRLENYNNKKTVLKKDIEKEDKNIVELHNREIMTANIYEITKKMSEDLTFDEIFAALSAFLKEHFIFTKSDLLILKEDAAYIKINRVYKLYKTDDVKHEDIETDYGDVLTLFDKDKKALYMPKEDSKSFSAIPLLSENKFVGILTVEDLPRIDFDRLVIVATQFALEMKKVLLYETVEALAITDSLTALHTRRYFFERFSEELTRSRRHGLKFAFLMVDIDDFKKCNDTHGHLVGDVVLREVSRVIKENVREIDLVARYGGEEFSLILPETDRKGAVLAADRIRKKIEENTFKAYDEKLKVTVSVGLAMYPEDALGSEDMIEEADKALYTAKNSGKNIVCECTR